MRYRTIVDEKTQQRIAWLRRGLTIWVVVAVLMIGFGGWNLAGWAWYSGGFSSLFLGAVSAVSGAALHFLRIPMRNEFDRIVADCGGGVYVLPTSREKHERSKR